MLKLKNLIFMLFVALFFQGCGGSSGGDDPEVIVVPELLSANPVNGATAVALKTSQVELTFDVEITLVSVSRITVNGTAVSAASVSGKVLSIALPKLNGETLYTIQVQAMAIKATAGAVNPEAISVSFTTGPKPAVIITSTLAVTNPSSQVLKVYNFLKENYGSKIVSGAMANVAWNINEAEWVKLQTGKYPAIATFDYIHLPFSPANWIDYSNITVLENWWNNNGLVSAGWHWIVPKSNGSSEYTYDPDETTFKAANATVEGTWENDVVKADLAKITGYLKLLRDKNIPVIWRPLHEAAGNIYEYTNGTAWFWWGSGGAEAYKKLWKYLFDYFESEGLNNLIWVWTTQTNDDAFYPGDDYVDLIGRDVYNQTDAAVIAAEFNTIQETYPTKMVTLSECGSVATISAQWTAGARWAMFMPWYDYDRTLNMTSSAFNSTEHKYANANWWVNAVGNSAVITLDEMSGLK